MSALFPHDAVVQRYLHTGKRRSRRKVVVASVLGMLACVVVAAALPAGAPKSSTEPSAPAEQAKAVTPEPVATVASQAEAALPSQNGAKTPAATAAIVANQPHPMPQQVAAHVSANPPAPTAPPVQAVAAPIPAPQPVAEGPIVQPQATVPVASPAPEHAADVAAQKRAAAKLARKHRLAAAERRNRAARLRPPPGSPQPGYVRMYELPDGRRVYQRVTGYGPGLGLGGDGRSFFAPVDPNVD